MPIVGIPGHQPRVHESVYLSPNAYVIGQVEIGQQSSVWFGSVVRGDVHSIRIGDRTNIQDLSIVHVTKSRFSVSIGSDVTIGHGVKIHGCTIDNAVLVGIGAILLDGCHVHEMSMIAAGTLVPPGVEIPSGVLAMGSPAKIKRELTSEEKSYIVRSAKNYIDYQAMYR
ncbi:MAG: gamma carbonic anhydrase family protein [Bdellovibrionales bacterium]|nr:gamma carbonic anhydrase family protein [Bdellovibrionales bacterium]